MGNLLENPPPGNIRIKGIPEDSAGSDIREEVREAGMCMKLIRIVHHVTNYHIVTFIVE
jgi:hypothetical protein